jgi:hypothetical protein
MGKGDLGVDVCGLQEHLLDPCMYMSAHGQTHFWHTKIHRHFLRSPSFGIYVKISLASSYTGGFTSSHSESCPRERGMVVIEAL